MTVQEITSDDLIKLIDTKNILVVDCYAIWCGPCRTLSKIIEELSEKLTDVKFVKLDIDQNISFATKKHIEVVPTIFIFRDGKQVIFEHSKGKFVDRIVGVVSIEKLESIISEILTIKK